MTIEGSLRDEGRLGGVCMLTFDDGPDWEWTPGVLAELDRCKARATFFVIGARVDCAPELARAAVDRGHDVELHCDRHVRHTEMTDRELEDDTRSGLIALERAGLPRPTRWRPPWGICSEATPRVAAEQDLELVGWTIDTHDWRGDASAEMLEAAGSGIEDGAIVLMHDALGPGARRKGVEETVGLIGPLCARAQGRGLRVVSLSQARARAMPRRLGAPG
jgi:peptidoglycan-N-acetylglucosamine deacetylase